MSARFLMNTANSTFTKKSLRKKQTKKNRMKMATIPMKKQATKAISKIRIASSTMFSFFMFHL